MSEDSGRVFVWQETDREIAKLKAERDRYKQLWESVSADHEQDIRATEHLIHRYRAVVDAARYATEGTAQDMNVIREALRALDQQEEGN